MLSLLHLAGDYRNYIKSPIYVKVFIYGLYFPRPSYLSINL